MYAGSRGQSEVIVPVRCCPRTPSASGSWCHSSPAQRRWPLLSACRRNGAHVVTTKGKVFWFSECAELRHDDQATRTHGAELCRSFAFFRISDPPLLKIAPPAA